MSGLDSRGVWLKPLLDVLPLSVYGILRSGFSDSQMDNQLSSFVPLERSIFHTADCQLPPLPECGRRYM
jgi:hypothetical protein